jgi:hypothetical protein
MAKIMLGVAEDAFIYPRSYYFVAPLGVGMTLERLLSDPDALKTAFMKKLADVDSPVNSWKPDRIDKVASIADSADYSIFDSAQLDDIVEAHRSTPYHLARFGGMLSGRPPASPAPSNVLNSESKYLDKLLSVYREKREDKDLTFEQIELLEWYQKHLNRQRTSFFSAESLRSFARDKVPSGTFEALKDDVYEGVVEVEQDDTHSDGISRLNAVLSAASAMSVDENALIVVWRPIDRKGICHQLANDDKLTWCREESR